MDDTSASIFDRLDRIISEFDGDEDPGRTVDSVTVRMPVASNASTPTRPRRVILSVDPLDQAIEDLRDLIFRSEIDDSLKDQLLLKAEEKRTVRRWLLLAKEVRKAMTDGGAGTHWPTAIQKTKSHASQTHYVTMDQAAALVNRSKRTLQKYLDKGTMPLPDVEGGGGKPHEWNYKTLKPWLEATFGKKLPELPPNSRLIAPERT